MAFSFDTKLTKVAFMYARLLEVPITASTMQKELEEHPFYPSLFSLSDIYEKYKLSNEAYNVDRESFDKLKEHTPFLAYTNFSNKSDFVIVTEINNTHVKYLYKDTIPEKVVKEDFLKNFREVIWTAEKNNLSGDVNYKQTKKYENNNLYINVLIALITFLIGIYILFFRESPLDKFQLFALLVLKVVGICMSFLLFLYEINNNNDFVNKLCTINKRMNCDAVLTSKASKIWGISWADIGLIYFLSTTIILFLPSTSLQIKAIYIAFMNAFAAPYIIFSIYYQAKVVKQWCALCLSIQALLFMELVWAIYFVWQHFPFSVDSSRIFLFLPSMLISIYFLSVMLYLLKPIFIKANDFNLYKTAYKRLLRNPDIFYNLLNQQDNIKEGWENLGILLGNPNASNVIVKVCNPYCSACDASHKKLKQLLASNQNFKLRIIYINSNTDLDKGTPVVKHLLSIASEGNTEKIKTAIDDWYLYSEKNFNTFSEKYPLLNNTKHFNTQVNEMNAWCRAAEVRYTPTIFVNGHRMPEQYDIEDLNFLF